MIRIVCQELEAWYLGDPDALAAAFEDENLRRIKNRPIYRNPDERAKPSKDLDRLTSRYQKIAGARKMADHLTWESNRSRSFKVFLDGIERLHQLA